jgi:hypothetical protein
VKVHFERAGKVFEDSEEWASFNGLWPLHHHDVKIPNAVHYFELFAAFWIFRSRRRRAARLSFGSAEHDGQYP